MLTFVHGHVDMVSAVWVNHINMYVLFI